MAEQLIFSAIQKIMEEVGGIGKDQTNKQQGFKFRGIDDVYNALHPLLAKHGVFTVPKVLEDRHEERASKSGGVLIYRILKMKYTYFASDGSSVSAIVMGEGMDSGDKSCAKAMSIAHKYSHIQVFNIPTKENDDPDHEVHEVKGKTQSPAPEKNPYAPSPTGDGSVVSDISSKTPPLASPHDYPRTCPKCGRDAIIKGKEEYGGGYVCFKKHKEGGCGAKFPDIGSLTGETAPEPQEPTSEASVDIASEAEVTELKGVLITAGYTDEASRKAKVTEITGKALIKDLSTADCNEIVKVLLNEEVSEPFQ